MLNKYRVLYRHFDDPVESEPLTKIVSAATHWQAATEVLMTHENVEVLKVEVLSDKPRVVEKESIKDVHLWGKGIEELKDKSVRLLSREEKWLRLQSALRTRDELSKIMHSDEQWMEATARVHVAWREYNDAVEDHHRRKGNEKSMLGVTSLKEDLLGDEGVYVAWQANIAMAFIDEMETARKMLLLELPLSDQLLYVVANRAAIHFLDSFIGVENKAVLSERLIKYPYNTAAIQLIRDKTLITHKAKSRMKKG